MSEDSSVNGQIVDSVASVVTLLTGQAPAQSFAMLDVVLLETLGMAMHNAVQRQQAAGMLSSAAVTAACSKMLATPLPLTMLPPMPAPSAGVSLLSSQSPNPPASSAAIAAAFAEGEAAIQTLQARAQGASADAAQAQYDLAQLAKDAAAAPSAG